MQSEKYDRRENHKFNAFNRSGKPEQVDTGDPGTFLEARFLMILMHREIKEERKSGNFSGEIRIGPKRL